MEGPAQDSAAAPPSWSEQELWVWRQLAQGLPANFNAAEGYGGAPILRAYDKASGKVVAELPLPGVASGKPMSYLLGGKQYIVLAVGKDHPAELVALALP